MENTTSIPSLCKGGCGFYGSDSTEGLCSRCFKDAVKKKQISPPAASGSNNAPSKASTSESPVSKLCGGVSSVDLNDYATPKSSKSSVKASKSDVNLDSLKDAPSTSSSMASSPASSVTSGPRNRCKMCRKRVGLTGITCRCGGLYCSEHRYDEAHGCTFDYKALGREEIRKNNPTIVSDKIERL